jgi:putative ABC transport system permease protein
VASFSGETVQTLWQDLRYGARMLLKNPSFTLIAVITLGLGIGANTAIFSVVDAVLLRPLSFKAPDELVIIGRGPTRQSVNSISYPEFIDVKEQNQVFEEVAASSNRDREFDLASDREPERIPGLRVSTGFFKLLGVEPRLGRAFSPEEIQVGQNRVAIIGHHLWQRRFGGDAEIVGKTLLLNAESHTVIGVLPPEFQYPMLGADPKVDVILPLAPDPERSSQNLAVLARLRPGVALAQAQANLDVIKENLARQYARMKADFGINILPLQEYLVRGSRSKLLLYFGAVAFVLLIACANVANLLLARAAVRQREMAIRLSLGATRWRVVRQLLAEGLLLAIAGGGLGLLLAMWGADFLAHVLSGSVTRIQETSLNARVLGFTFALSLLSSVVFGLAPAILASKPDLNEALKEGQRQGSGGLRRNRLRGLLVVTQVALTLVLLLGAGLLVRSLRQLHKIELGFETENVLTMRVSLPRAKYAGGQQAREFFQQVTDRVEAAPGVEAVGLVDILPLTGSDTRTQITIEGPSAAGSQIGVSVRSVNHDYFRALGIPLLSGRYFTEHDDQSAPRAAIINQALAQHLWPGEVALGKRVRFGGQDSPWVEIVGVAPNVRHWIFNSQPPLEIYSPYLQRPMRSAYLTIRSSTRPDNLVAAIRREVLAVDKDQPVYNVKTLGERLADNFAGWRLPMFLMSLFAGLALALAAAGIYGVLSYLVAQRTQEIGVRIALGAKPRDIRKLVVGQGLALIAVGVALGLIAAVALKRVMVSLVYEVSATDPWTIAAITLLLAAVALVACWIPARRATKVDPIVALRSE